MGKNFPSRSATSDAKIAKEGIMAAQHHFYDDIVRALEAGTLTEPFTCDEVERSCPGTEGLSRGFLDEHAVGNDAGNPELFEEVAPGRYRCSPLGDYAI